MKVLATGFSPPQCGRPTQTGYEHVSDLWVKGFRAGGADVEHRRVEPNEPLEGYDVALIGLVPPNSIAARYMYTALDVIARAHESGCGLIFYVDDWRYYAIKNGLRVTVKNPRRRLIETQMFDNFWCRDWAITEGWDRVCYMLECLNALPWPTTLIPAFNWGDHTKLPTLPTREMAVIDPSAFARKYVIDRAADETRRRAWVMGTFSDQRHWIDALDLTWEHDYIGTRRSKAEGKAIKEPVLVSSYGQSWGVLGAPYGHAGSGWWRNRFVYAAKAGAVMLADPVEVAGLGPGYHHPSHVIESMTHHELRITADAQANLLRQHEEPAESVTEQLMTHAEHARNVARGNGLIDPQRLVAAS